MTTTAIDLHDQGKPLTLVDADVAAGAAIAYSKLNLAASIVDADMVSVAYSKVTGRPAAGYYAPLTNGNAAAPEVIFDSFGDVIMVFING